eukprot:108091_1
MMLFTLFIVVLCVVKSEIATTQEAEKSNYQLLLKHRPGDIISDEERAEMRQIFNRYDKNDDDCLDKLEFRHYINNELHIDDGFNFMDINGDSVLRYGELVYVLRQFESVPDLQTREIKTSLATIFGDKYDQTSNNDPEYLAMILFEQLDPMKNYVIKRKEYMDFKVNAEWNEYDKYEINFNGECISFEQFRKHFFGNPQFIQVQTIYEEKEYGVFNLEEISNNILSAEEQDIESMDVMYGPHEFDLTQSPRRRLFWWIFVAVAFVVFVAVALIAVGISVAQNSGCYDGNGLISILNKGILKIKDAAVGDYVFDGYEFSKIFYIHKESHNKRVKMNKIKYGKPDTENDNINSITLTPNHLLYVEGYEYPFPSSDISIGDTLINIYGNNGTVYNIETVYSKPITPVTNSGNLMVNGVKTSVFTKSIKEHNRLQRSGAMFRWVSDNINQEIAVNMIDFYYDGVYRGMMSNNIVKDICLYNNMSTTLCIAAFPLFAMYVCKKILRLMFCCKKSQKK